MASKRWMKPVPVAVASAVVLLFMLAAAIVAREHWIGAGDASADRLAALYALDFRHPGRLAHGARLTEMQEPRSGYVSTRVYELSDRMLLVGKRSDGKWHVVEIQNVF